MIARDSGRDQGAPAGALVSRLSPFTRAYIALLDGGRVFVLDRHGNRGEIITITEGDRAEHRVGEAMVQFRGRGVVTYRADKFNRDLVLA